MCTCRIIFVQGFKKDWWSPNNNNNSLSYENKGIVCFLRGAACVCIFLDFSGHKFERCYLPKILLYK